MATQVNAATAKAGTNTVLNESRLRKNAPQLRTGEAILEKNEQILDGMEHGSVTPKMAEQMSQCCKMPLQLANMEMRYLKMIQGFGRKAPVPRTPILRAMAGLNPDKLLPGDGAAVRALVGDAE